MKAKTIQTFSLLFLLFPLSVAAQPGGSGLGGPGGGRKGPPPFMAELFRPELLMRHQTELELTRAQKESIMKAVRSTRNDLDPLQWKLEESQQKMTKLLAGPRIDEEALVVQAEEVMTLEKELKKAHLLLLARLKNELTPQQQEKAKSFRRGRSRGHHRGGPRQPSPGAPHPVQ